MRKPILIAAFVLAGCSSAGDKAAREYALVENSPSATDADKCAAATRVRDAYRADDDGSNFEVWSVTASTNCLRARLSRH